ncbi:hypothetical protein I7I48_09570 [Histoplasma ohiense]|nr:hypothetical protein I7I48_09570 [Histoplasma ohiense (nom. inval.)]
MVFDRLKRGLRTYVICRHRNWPTETEDSLCVQSAFEAFVGSILLWCIGGLLVIPSSYNLRSKLVRRISFSSGWVITAQE